MRTVSGTATTPFGICGFGYVDEGLPKEQALKKLKLEMENNLALRMFLSQMPVEKRKAFVKNMIDAIMGNDNQNTKACISDSSKKKLQ
ncbi:MAG: hypothetical protein K6F69_06855 [Treponema sp.]|nr:hypothetical protein [Treponema sp.]